MKKNLRGKTLGGSVEPGVYTEGMPAVVKHGATIAHAKSASAVTSARANDPPCFSLIAFFQPRRFWISRSARSPKACGVGESESSSDPLRENMHLIHLRVK
jgi:hypothetical protein